MISLQQLKPATVFPVYDRIIPQYLLFSCDIPYLKKVPKSGNNLNRPVFPGVDLICELGCQLIVSDGSIISFFCFCRRNMARLFQQSSIVIPVHPRECDQLHFCSVFPALTVYYLRFVKAIDALRHRDVIRVACTPC